MLLVLYFQDLGDVGQVAALDGRPEPRLRRRACTVAADRDRRFGRCLHPVPLVLEGVGGQVDPVRGGQDRLPVHAQPGDVRLRERGDQPRGTAVVPLQRAHRQNTRDPRILGRLHHRSVSTGCGDTSTNAPKPSPSSTRTASSKRTIRRRFANQ